MIHHLNEEVNKFKSILVNFGYNLSYQLLSLLLPFVTVPYITRIFSQNIIGLNSVTQANCSYFSLLGMLGIALLGPREIAKCQGNQKLLSIRFSEIYMIQFIAHCISLTIYIVHCMLFNNIILGYVYIFSIIATMFDISWFFIGVEDFKSISIRNAFIKILSFVLLFLCVHEEKDIYLYVLTLYLPQIFMNVYMWNIINKNYKIRCSKQFNKKIFTEAFSLFLPQISSTIYTVLDKTILGVLSTYKMVAIYTQGQSLIRLFLAIVPSFSRVMLPRISSSIKENNEKETNYYLRVSANIIGAIAFLLYWGVLALAGIFVEWYLPIEYNQTSDILRICAFIIIPVSGANVIAIQYLIPSGQQKKYTVSIIISTIVNVLLNFLLVPFWNIYGVCIASIIAEVTGFGIQLYYVRKFLNLKQIFSNAYIFCTAGALMFFCLIQIQEKVTATFINILVLALLGTMIYAAFVFGVFRISRLSKLH